MVAAKKRPIAHWGARAASLGVLAGSLLVGCGDAGCPELCEKTASCAATFGQPEQSAATCEAQCEALSQEDPAFAEAVAERAECLQDVSCDELYFTCLPSGE